MNTWAETIKGLIDHIKQETMPVVGVIADSYPPDETVPTTSDTPRYLPVNTDGTGIGGAGNAAILRAGGISFQDGDQVVITKTPVGNMVTGFISSAAGMPYPVQRADQMVSPGDNFELESGGNTLNLSTAGGSATIGGATYDFSKIGKVLVSSGDTTPDYLNSQLIVDTGTDLLKTIATPGGNESLILTYIGTPRIACRVATTANIASLSTLLTIDGVTLVANDRVLVKDQSTASQNGIWLAASGSWVRAGDFNAAADVPNGVTVAVREGTQHGGTLWMMTTNPVGITVGSTSLAFTRIDPYRTWIDDGGTTMAQRTKIKIEVGHGVFLGLTDDSANNETEVFPSLDFLGLTDNTVLDIADDYIAIYDSSAGEHRLLWTGYAGWTIKEFTATADKTVGNTGSETSLYGTGVGSRTLVANRTQPGTVTHFRLSGYLSTKAAGAGTLNIKAKFGSAELCSTGAVTVTDNLSNVRFEIAVDVTTRTDGGSGTVVASGELRINGTAYAMVKTTTTTIDSTATQPADVTATWGTSDVANTMTAQLGTVEVAG